MFAGVFVIAAMGIVTYLIFAFIERRMTRWAIRGRDMQAFGGG
jgi:NitT/TauT family transport system permease protein